MTAYMWLAQKSYPWPVGGAIYSEIRKKLPTLKKRDEELLRQTRVLLSPARIAQFERYLPFELAEMACPEEARYPSPSYDCSWSCEYFLLCRLLMEDGDLDDAKQNYYTQEER